MDSFFHSLFHNWLTNLTIIEDILLSVLTLFLLVRFKSTFKRYNDCKLIKYYLNGLLILTLLGYVGEIPELLIPNTKKLQLNSLITECCNQFFSGLEFFVFSQLLFRSYVTRKLGGLVLVLSLICGVFFFALTLNGNIDRLNQMKFGELTTVIEFIAFIVLSNMYAYAIYRKGHPVEYEKLVLLTVFFGYCLLSTPFFLLARYLHFQAYEYEEFFYRVHLWSLVVVCFGIWNYLSALSRKEEFSKNSLSYTGGS